MEQFSEKSKLHGALTGGSRTMFLLLAALVLTVYAGSLSHDFTGDDVTLFLRNDFYHHLENVSIIFSSDFILQYQDVDPASVQKGFYSGFVAYRPVTAISFFIDGVLWDKYPFGYHLTNILLHIFAVCLVFALLRRLLKSDETALLASLLFAIHPVHAELINTVGYRSDLISAIFYISALLFFIKFREKGKGRVFLTASCVAFALAVFAKESAVTLPVMLVAYDVFCHRGEHARRTAVQWPYFIFLSILAFYLYVYFVVFPNATLSARIDVPVWDKARLFIRVFAYDLRALFWPFRMTVLPQMYWPSFERISAGEIAAVALFLTTGIAAAARFFKRAGSPTLTIFWFFVTYLPVANIMASPNPLAYRFLYLPSVGFFAVFAFLIEKASRRLPARPGAFGAGLALKIVIVALCAVLTIRLNPFFRNNLVLCQKMIRDFPDAPRPFWILGLTYLDSGQYDKAIEAFENYLKIEDKNPFVRNTRQDYFIHHQLGRCYVHDPHKAIAEFKEAVRLRPGYAAAHADLAKAYLLASNSVRAFEHAARAIALDEDIVPGYVYAVHSALELGKRETATGLLKKALTISPRDPNLQYLENRMRTEQ